MADIIYTAKRSVKAGHTSGTDYTLSILFLIDTAGSQRIGPRPAVALSGAQVTTTHRVEKTRSLETDYVSTATTPAVADLVEFLDSVIGGEQFSIDGVNYRLVSDSYSEQNEGKLFKKYAFKVRAV